jgi:hypothetical protein
MHPLEVLGVLPCERRNVPIAGTGCSILGAERRQHEATKTERNEMHKI